MFRGKGNIPGTIRKRCVRSFARKTGLQRIMMCGLETNSSSEAPNESRGSAEIVLCGAQQVGAHVVELQTPCEMMQKPELELAIDTAARIFCNWIMGKSIGGEPLAASHDVHERPPLPIIHRKPRSKK